jgi:hypothetical protein
MKRLFFTIAMFLFAYTAAKAQEGTIIYTDFEPDTMQTVYTQIPGYEPMYVDFDGDGQYDLKFYAEGHIVTVYARVLNPSEWDISLFCNEPNKPLTEKGEWLKKIGFNGSYCEKSPDSLCIRHKIGDQYYYGWFRAYAHSWDLHPIGPAKVVLDKMAWCTIPDYPLVWGQTSLIGMEENEYTPFAIVHPNPTTGLFTIVGENLHQVKVFDMLGQAISTYQVNGHSITIDISSLSIGVYFVNITDENGQRCVQKIVKE